jgi:PAS domain S-box-containing protein
LKINLFIRYILLLFFAGLIFLLVFTYQNIRHHKETLDLVNQTHQVIERLHTVQSSLLNVESKVRGYVITGNPVFLDGYKTDSENLQRNVQALHQLSPDIQGQPQRGAALLNLVKQKIAWQDTLIALHHTSHLAAQSLISRLKGKTITDEFSAIIRQWEKDEQTILRKHLEESDRLTRIRNLTFFLLSGCAFIALIVLTSKVSREMRRRRSAEQKAQLSENKYKELIENSSLVVFTMDLDLNFSYLSGKCRDITGFKAEDLVGESLLTIVESNWRGKVLEFYQAQKENQTFETVLEFPVINKNGDRHWIEQSVVLIMEKEKPVGYQSITKEITERKFAEQLLKEAELRIKLKQEEYQERLQAILNNMPMIVYLKALDGRFMMVNRQFHETFNTTDEAVIGKTEINVHTSESGLKRFEEADEQVKRTGKPLEIEESLMTREGERNMLIVKYPLFDKNNELFAISAVGKDITELIRYQRQLITARKRAEKAERLQEEFLANMSHEIRTPMNGIIGMTNLMKTTGLNEEQGEYLHLIEESSGILLALINDILDLSKIKSGRMCVENVDYNLHQTIDSILAPFCVKAREKNIEINKIFQDLPKYLLSNAVKFTNQGTVTLFATTEKRADNKLYLICSVSDTGIGIAAENHEQVFESFVQAGSDMVRRFGGTGLGLAITKRLIELQGGKITVDSTLGEGTSFYVELPIVLSQGIHEEPAAAPLEEKGSSTIELRGKRILLIEDNLVNQKVTYLMLYKAGMEVHIANHGKEAVELLERESYDLIITDLQMPEMDGFQTAVYIRNKLNLHTPIIAMTASALRNEKDRCLQLGMNEYLTKPFSPASLFHHLKRYLLAPGEALTEKPLDPEEYIQNELYNLSYLEEMDDAEYATEVLDLFLTTTPQTLAEIKDLTFREEWEKVYKKAHNLKSSLGILQMNKMLGTVAEIELIARDSSQTELIENLLNYTEQQYDLVKPMLEAELQSTRKKLVL